MGSTSRQNPLKFSTAITLPRLFGARTTMNSNFAILLFMLVISGLIWTGMQNNDPSWTGNKNQCIDEWYADWKAENGGSIADVERVKQ